MLTVALVCHNAVCAAVVLLAFGAVELLHSKTDKTQLPTFDDYPVKQVFNGTPHPPILTTREQRLFRTRIRHGVQKGWGVWVNGQWSREQGGPGPNFAGRYIVIVWGCGSGCLRMAMSDAATGKVYDPPISDGEFVLPILVSPRSAGRAADVQYRRDSRLMIIKATPHVDRRDAVPFAFYFLWQGDRWTLLRRVRIEE